MLKLLIIFLSVLAVTIAVSPSLPIANLATRSLEIRIYDLLQLLLIYLAFMVLFMTGKLRGMTKSVKWFLYFLAGALLSTLLGALFHNVPNLTFLESIFMWLKHLQYLLLFWLAAYLATSRRERITPVLYAAIIGAVITIAFGMIQILTGSYGYVKGAGRTTMLFEGGPNVSGTYLAIFAPITLAFALGQKSSVRKFLWFILSIACLLVIAYTGSRASFDGALIGALLVLGMWKQKLNWVSIGILAFVTLFGLYVLFIASDSPIVRLAMTKDLPTLGNRLEDWYPAVLTFTNRPLLGTGLGLSGQKWVENYYLRVLVEQGVVGMVFFLGLIVNLIREVHLCYRKSVNPTRKSFALGYLGSIVTLLVASVWADKFLVVQIAMTFWLLGGLLSGYSSQFHRPQKASETVT